MNFLDECKVLCKLIPMRHLLSGFRLQSLDIFEPVTRGTHELQILETVVSALIERLDVVDGCLIRCKDSELATVDAFVSVAQ